MRYVCYYNDNGLIRGKIPYYNDLTHEDLLKLANKHTITKWDYYIAEGKKVSKC